MVEPDREVIRSLRVGGGGSDAKQKDTHCTVYSRGTVATARSGIEKIWRAIQMTYCALYRSVKDDLRPHSFSVVWIRHRRRHHQASLVGRRSRRGHSPLRVSNDPYLSSRRTARDFRLLVATARRQERYRDASKKSQGGSRTRNAILLSALFLRLSHAVSLDCPLHVSLSLFLGHTNVERPNSQPPLKRGQLRR